jgi:hypothetical protein
MTTTAALSRRAALALMAGTTMLPRGPRAESAGTPVLIELFTSQGCSSCPPPTHWQANWLRIPLNYVVSLNVDYWDYLGWNDTLAKPEFSKRQFDYGKSRGDMEVYTPQMVMNGHYHAVGSKSAEVRKFIARMPGGGLEGFTLARRHGQEVKVTIPAQAFTGEATLWLMAIAPQVKAVIGRGENAGKTVTNHNVVRNMVPAALWKGEDYHGAWMRDAVVPADCTSCIAVLQKDKTGQVIGLARA